MIYLAGYRGTSFISNVIRARTGIIPFIVWARYSHFSIVDMDRDKEIESWFPDGVQTGKVGSRHTPGTSVDLYRFKDPLTSEQEAELWRILTDEIGKPYDWAGCLGFLWLARALGFHHKRGAWFCSELCKWAARQIGRLLKGWPPYKESPEDISHEAELIFDREIIIKGTEKKGGKMKGLVLKMAVLGLVLGLSGCASIYTVAKHDEEVMARNAVKLQAVPGGAAVSIDVLKFGTGYFQAWADNPGKMTVASFLDLATGAGLYLAGKELSSGSSDGSPATPTTLTINGNGNTIVIGNGTGTSSNEQQETE
jgi:hypothetical protein